MILHIKGSHSSYLITPKVKDHNINPECILGKLYALYAHVHILCAKATSTEDTIFNEPFYVKVVRPRPPLSAPSPFGDDDITQLINNLIPLLHRLEIELKPRTPLKELTEQLPEAVYSHLSQVVNLSHQFPHPECTLLDHHATIPYHT